MKMAIINITEWCVDALVCGLAFLSFAIGTFIFLLVGSVVKDYITRKYKEYGNG
jgi:sulfite exporter TauE/SafE